MLIARLEPTAEASLARMRERRKLGMAIAATIKHDRYDEEELDQRESLWFRMNSPQTGATMLVIGRRLSEAGPTSFQREHRPIILNQL